jgi:3-deoxy-D-manno-octulosonic-acid transferase
MIRLLYDLLFILFAIGYLPLFLIKGKHRKGFAMRFGAVPKEVRDTLLGKKVLWIHAVSVGEVQVASGFLEQLKARFKDHAILMTVTTMTGFEVARRLCAKTEALLYFPIDLSFCIRRFIDTVNPCAVIVLETEIWPNLLWQLRDRRIPTVILNGRISDKAIRAYRRMRFFFKDVLSGLGAIGVQDESMRRRFVEIGADARRVVVTGNVKFDFEPPQRPALEAALSQRIKAPGEILFVAGSTHEGEERMIFESLPEIKRACPRIKFLIAPRHLDRMASIESDASRLGIRAVKVSSKVLLNFSPNTDGQTVVYLLNQMGVLTDFYALADIVFVGGSLVSKGGHNLVEPAYYSKPILFGPHMQNFSRMASIFKEHCAAIEVADVNDLKNQIKRLAEDANIRKSLGDAAKRLIESQKGAVEKNLALFETYVREIVLN